MMSGPLKINRGMTYQTDRKELSDPFECLLRRGSSGQSNLTIKY